MRLAPIALFAYKRPMHLQHVLEALGRDSLAAASHLHVFSDGAKSEDVGPLVAEVRALARTIKGFASVTLYERDRNMGLAASIIDGVTRLCSEHGRVIVVEDDLLVAPGFLAYMNLALDRYQDDEQVMQISGYMLPVDLHAQSDAVFLPFTTSWGWATWARAWRWFDIDMLAFERLSRDAVLRRQFNLGGTYDYFELLRRQLRGEVDSWAIRWYLSVFMRRGLTLYPVRTLVRNIGFDGSGTHCADAHAVQGAVAPEFAPQRFPDSVELYPGWREVLAGLPARPRRFRTLLRRAKALIPIGGA